MRDKVQRVPFLGPDIDSALNPSLVDPRRVLRTVFNEVAQRTAGALVGGLFTRVLLQRRKEWFDVSSGQTMDQVHREQYVDRVYRCVTEHLGSILWVRICDVREAFGSHPGIGVSQCKLTCN